MVFLCYKIQDTVPGDSKRKFDCPDRAAGSCTPTSCTNRASGYTAKIPYPFITQGANPVHVYSSFAVSGSGCLIPTEDITDKFTINPTTIVLPNAPSPVTEISITPKTGYSGFAYVTTHLEYGLKKQASYEKLGGNAIAYSPAPLWNINDQTLYLFAFTGGSDPSSYTIKNLNEFKKIVGGSANTITKANGDPVPNVQVQFINPQGKVIETSTTDADGYVYFLYKHTGKAATYKMKVPAYKLELPVVLKANGYGVANFQIP